MAHRINPFNELYVTEQIDPKGFVQVFSPLLVSDTLALFQPGNVVLMGVQGSGKSMLLALLKPETRIAYAEANMPFPVPEDCGRFVGAGINLTRSGAIDFGQRPMEPEASDEVERLPAYFADFLNYWIVRDLLNTLSVLSNASAEQVSKPLGINASSQKLDRFARLLAGHSCWAGYLNSVHNYTELKDALTERISQYRNFINYNSNALPEEVRRSKTSAGEPISATAEALWESGVLAKAVPVFVRIDQYEELSRLEDWSREKKVYQQYGAVVNKMMGTRDPRVSYRIGTRLHAWNESPRMHGTAAVLEELRNYRSIDLDALLRRKENRPWLFRDFAEDVFRRRVTYEGFQPRTNSSKLLPQVFGPGPTPAERARAYARNVPVEALQLEPTWSKEICELLQELAQKDPLSAKLGEAWIRQQMERKAPILPRKGHLPWELPRHGWWRKERLAQALLQIAARQKQKMIWAGTNDILALSGSNILVFVSICQNVWAAWLRSEPLSTRRDEDSRLPEIKDPLVQDEGIQQASTYWFRKIRADPGGDGRQRFISLIGKLFRQRLRGDARMSYPGESGFSLALKDLESSPDVNQHLREAVAFGVMNERPHTPKSKSRGESRKWYLNPILSPYFQIPVVHQKEPMYVTVERVREWLSQSQVLRYDENSRPPQGEEHRFQMPLFENPEGGEA